VTSSLASSVMRGRVSTAVGPVEVRRRERMRGRLGTGTEGVDGRWHGPGMLPARRNWQHVGLFPRRSAHPLGQLSLEPEGRSRTREVHSGR